MAVIGVFGKLQDRVTIVLGDPLTPRGPVPWQQTAVPPNVLTSVLTLVVPVDGRQTYLNFVTAGGQNYCRVVLKVGATVLLDERSSPGTPQFRWTAPLGSEWIGAAGESFELLIEHFDSIALDFSGIVGGYRR